MYINEDDKIIFLHNPNCGGRFIRSSLSLQNDLTSAYKYWGPYTRELNTDLSHINKFTLPRFYPNWRQFRIVTLIRNPYNRFMSAWNVAKGNNLRIQYLISKYNTPLSFLNYVDKLNYYEQDRILRSPEIPWFNPQSYYVDRKFIVLKYEKKEDWTTLFDLLKITNMNLRIKTDYTVQMETCRLLKKLYYDDEDIFSMYET